MSLQDQLMADLKVAMKEKDRLRKLTITMLRAAIKQVEVDNRCELNNDDIISIIAKQIKQKKSAIEEFAKADRMDLVEEAQAEIKVLEAYLPEQMSQEEIVALVEATIAETGASSMKDMGKVVGIISGKTKGRADGSTIAALVKGALNK